MYGYVRTYINIIPKHCRGIDNVVYYESHHMKQQSTVSAGRGDAFT